MGPEIDCEKVKTPQDVKDHFYKISNRKDIVIEDVRWMTTWTYVCCWFLLVLLLTSYSGRTYV